MGVAWGCMRLRAEVLQEALQLACNQSFATWVSRLRCGACLHERDLAAPLLHLQASP